MNNFEKIKQMDIEEMNDFLAKAEDLCNLCSYIRKCQGHCFNTRRETIALWLESEVQK